MKAGSLYFMFAFEQRLEIDEPHGNTKGPWVEQFRCRASRMDLRGGETVMAARLQGRGPVIVTVRKDPTTDKAGPDWRCIDTATGETFNIISVQPTDKRDAIEFLCERGVADG